MTPNYYHISKGRATKRSVTPSAGTYSSPCARWEFSNVKRPIFTPPRMWMWKCFTVVDIVDGVVSEEATMVANPPHEEGGCLRPVGLLADAGCNAIVAAGMGMRPLMGFNQAGITVYYDAEHPIVGDAVRAVAAGEAPIMSADQACNHHH